MQLNIGGQKGKDKFPLGWATVDTRKGADFRVDISESTLPFDDDSVNAIYTSHTLEHIFPDKLPFVLSEFHRVLRMDGVIRIVVPDIDIALRAYASGDVSFLRNSCNPRIMNCLPTLPIYFLSSWFFTYRDGNPRIMDGHLNVFNKQSLFHYLSRSNFTNITKKRYGKCSKVFGGCDFKRYKNCSLYVESQKVNL